MFKGTQSSIVELPPFKGARAAIPRVIQVTEKLPFFYASIKNSEFSIFISIIIILKVFRHIMRGAFTEEC